MTKPSYEELRIAKHSASPQIADSASSSVSDQAVTETRCEHRTLGVASVPIIHRLQSYRCPDCGVPVWFCDACKRGHAISEQQFQNEWALNGRPEVALTAAEN